MSDRIANIIILGEDQEHIGLVRRYLLRVGQNDRAFRIVPPPGNRGCGSQFVREQFADQVAECRRRLGRGASCMLIVLTDADNLTTLDRERTLQKELNVAGHAAVNGTEPIFLLIPKWQVETWVKSLLGQFVSEDDRHTDRPPVEPEAIKEAAVVIFNWSRTGAVAGVTCVPSLTAALPSWKRIG